MNRIQFVRHESYTFPSSRGKVVIRRNQFEPAKWDLLIGTMLVRKAHYSSAEEAALRASENDFGDDYLNRIYTGLHVSADLENFWKYSAESSFIPVNHGN